MARTTKQDTPGTEVATTSDAALAAQEELEAQLVAENAAEVDASDFQIPLLKIGQPLTDEVTSGDASAGEFINSLTREGLGDKINFVVAGFQKGRFFHGDEDNGRRARKAYGVANVPWSDDPFYGQPFTEHPDAEEQYSERVNKGEIEWGKGPSISTTYDFTGFVLSDDPDEQPFPVCLSLMRTNSKAAKKWVTLLQAVLRNKYWDAVFELSTERTQAKKGTFYVLNIKQGPRTTPEQKQAALELALILRQRGASFVGDADSEAASGAAPAAEGGMAV